MARVSATRRRLNNLLVNGDFEYAPDFTAATTSTGAWVDGTAAGTTVDGDKYGWKVYGVSGGQAQFDAAQQHSGTTSMKLSTTAVGQYVEVHRCQTNDAAQNRRYLIPVSPSTSYTCTFWMKTNVASGTSNGGAYISAQEYDGGNTLKASNASTMVKTTTDWAQYTITFTTNAATKLVNPRLTVYGHTGTGTLIMDAWFDDIEFGPTTPLTRTAA